MRLLDLAVELERRLVVILHADRRAEVDAEVEAVVGGEEQRRADRHYAGGDLLAVDFHHDLERTGGLGLDVSGLDFDLHFAGRQFVLGLDVRAHELEQVVFVGQHAVLHVAG